MGKSVLIIGGGVAGIAAALPLADAGFQVQIVEKRPLLGGRASSHCDPKTGERIDECQHGTMRCCTNLNNLLERLGVADQIRYHRTIHFLDREGKRSVIKGCGLPAPLHTSLSFLCFRSLSLRDKLSIAYGMLAMLMERPGSRYDAMDIGTWFQKMGQTERAVQRFWTPILVSTCNEDNARISCTYAFKIFRDGFLKNARAFHFGVPRVPLATLYTEPTLAYLKQRSGCVRLRTIVDQIHFTSEAAGSSAAQPPMQGAKEETWRVDGVSLVGGERLEADYYVSALQCDLLSRLLPLEVTRGIAYWENLQRIELAPIIGVHLWFDRKIDCPEALATLDRETEWIFNKTCNFDQPEGQGTYLSTVISASHHLAATSKEEILATVLADVRACLPDTRAAELVRSQVVKWPKATISPKPGVDKLRPDQCSPIANLFVAGEWTQTGWPSTMESAVRSGYRAAEYILEQEGTPQHLLVPDLPTGLLARLLDGHRNRTTP